MAPERFEELPVWKYSIDLARRVLRCTSHPAMAKHPEFARQLENNALGIGNQIVTAVSSRDPRSLADSIAMARICTARTRSMLHLLESGKRDQALSDVDKMKTLADRVERYLTGWLRSLTEDPTRRPKATSAPATPPAAKEKIDLADLVELRDPSPATSNEPSADDAEDELIAEAEAIEEPAGGDAINPLEALARAASDSAEKTETPPASPKQGPAAPAAQPPQPAAPPNASPAANTSQLEEVLAELAGQSEDPFASLPDEKKN